MKHDNFEQSHSAKKSERGTIWDFQTSIMFQKIKKMKGNPLVQAKNFRKKVSYCRKKLQVKNTQIANVGILSCFQIFGRRFHNFGRGSKVCSMFWSN